MPLPFPNHADQPLRGRLRKVGSSSSAGLKECCQLGDLRSGLALISANSILNDVQALSCIAPQAIAGNKDAGVGKGGD